MKESGKRLTVTYVHPARICGAWDKAIKRLGTALGLTWIGQGCDREGKRDISFRPKEERDGTQKD